VARSAAPDALVRYLPLRRNPNIAAAIIAAWVPRWHRASSFGGAVQVTGVLSGELRLTMLIVCTHHVIVKNRLVTNYFGVPINAARRTERQYYCPYERSGRSEAVNAPRLAR
jgi:hypothetical protein